MSTGYERRREMVRRIAEHQHALAYAAVLIKSAAREVEWAAELRVGSQFLSDVPAIEVVIRSYRRRGET